MKTTAVRLYGANDLRLEEFELPPINEEELLIRIISDSMCMSTYKAVMLGALHKRVPDNVAEESVVIGHEMCCEIIEVGKKLEHSWHAGEKIVIQPALNMTDNDYSVGYSFSMIGGNMTYAIVPKEVLDQGCVLKFKGETFFEGSMAEPLSCILRAFISNYHIDAQTFKRTDGTKKGGKIAILGGAGPMGIGAIDIALHFAEPSMVVVTDINEKRLAYAESIFNPVDQKKRGIDLRFINAAQNEDQEKYLKKISETGFDDVFVMFPSPASLELGNRILGVDGCMNFFAGPTDRDLSAAVNFYRIHYDFIHIVGTSGGIPQDMVEIIELIERGVLHPSFMITHIGGLDSVIKSIREFPGGNDLKKLVYPGLHIPMTPISELSTGGGNPFRDHLAHLVEKHGGLWNWEAEAFLLKYASQM